MKFTTFQIHNIRGFAETEPIKLSSTINIFTGKNNSGKSTILKTFLVVQDRSVLNQNDLRIGATQGKAIISLSDTSLLAKYASGTVPKPTEVRQFSFNIRANKTFNVRTEGENTSSTLDEIPGSEPDNIIYPFLSKRKVHQYSGAVETKSANTVGSDFKHLPAKIARMTSPDFDFHEDYKKACIEILNIGIFAASSDSGMQAGIRVNPHQTIAIDSMGDGVANILALIENLCMAKDKIFIIEELENDLHPESLKALLKMIIEKSKENQFFISTHSNIVIKYLGSLQDSKLFNIDMEIVNRIPTSTIIEVDTPEKRQEVLENLGYDLLDFDLAKGWLILEESSAETIVKQLITWFVPDLQDKLRTVETKGVDKVKRRFEAFNDLFLYLHLQPMYRERVWVLIDGDTKGSEVVADLISTYCGKDNSVWSSDHFKTLCKANFEEYYPDIFADKVAEISKATHSDKRELKRTLLNEVKEWIKENEEQAKQEFSVNAKEIIDLLRIIDEKL